MKAPKRYGRMDGQVVRSDEADICFPQFCERANIFMKIDLLKEWYMYL